MHVLLGIGVLAGLVYYAFGETMARIFVGAALGLLALLVCVVMGIAVIDMQRQEARTAYTQALR